LPLGTFREFGSGIVPQIVANSMATIDLWDIVSLAVSILVLMDLCIKTLPHRIGLKT